MKDFDWHRDTITRSTPITDSYRSTQNVRRFFCSICGGDFKMDRAFMALLRSGSVKTMGEAADAWLRRNRSRGT